MQFSKGIEYALHCLLHMTIAVPEKNVTIKDLAAYQGISETYLSKIYTKLKKAGIVKSVPGANGGYELARAPEDISFQDVVEAVEGTSPMFQCAEIRQQEILLDKNNLPDSFTKCPCLIKVVMLEAEDQMKHYLGTKTLAWLSDQVRAKVPAEYGAAMVQWFNNNVSR